MTVILSNGSRIIHHHPKLCPHHQLLLPTSPTPQHPPSNPLIEMIKRVKISRLKKNKATPNMRGRVLGKSTNKYEVWVADSGTSISIIPVNITKRNGIKWRPIEGCQREAASKGKKKCEVIPPDLTLVASAKSISIDFAVYSTKTSW